MTKELVACEQCGEFAEVKRTDGLLEPDPRWPTARVVQLIECPRCGLIEQPLIFPNHRAVESGSS
jgi:hypothetical protein